MAFSWRIATYPFRCGFCGRTVGVDDAYLAVYVHAMQRTFIRCLACGKDFETSAARRAHLPGAPAVQAEREPGSDDQ
jgi:DNA-directed RNA polymerase subunit RPC12/RpoP